MLTIAIPTYNRHSKLLETLNVLSSLAEIITLNIIIVDNCSIPDVEAYLVEHSYPGFGYTKIYRNGGNVGLGANLLMCFVHTRTEWMWLLGDDDLPIQNCLVDIITEINNADKNTFLLKFNSHAGESPDFDTVIPTEADFIRYCSNLRYYSNMLFISNSIFRVLPMQNHLRSMYEFTNTMAPHIVGILKNLSESMQIKLINKYITCHGRAEDNERWDMHRLREGVLYFSDIKGHDEFRKKMVSKLYREYLCPKRFYIPLFVYPFRHKNYDVTYWSWFYWKSAFLFDGEKSFYLLFLAVCHKFAYRSKMINKIMHHYML